MGGGVDEGLQSYSYSFLLLQKQRGTTKEGETEKKTEETRHEGKKEKEERGRLSAVSEHAAGGNSAGVLIALPVLDCVQIVYASVCSLCAWVYGKPGACQTGRGARWVQVQPVNRSEHCITGHTHTHPHKVRDSPVEQQTYTRSLRQLRPWWWVGVAVRIKKYNMSTSC